jgi:hypothetical protein
MTPLLKPLVALSLLLAACASPERAPTAAQLAAAESGATALVENWASAGSEGRWDDLVTLYADEPGFAWIEQGENRYPDHDAAAAGVAQARDANLTVRTSVEDIVVTPVAPDAAAVRAKVSIVFGDPSQGGFAFDGMLTGVAIERDGRWMFLQGHLSSPPPRQEPSAEP